MKRAFVGVIHGGDHEDGSGSGGETVIYSSDESSTGETESLYQLQDGRIEGCSNGNSILDPLEPPNWVGVFMAGTQPRQNSLAVAVAATGSAAAGPGDPRAPRLRF